MNKLSARWIMGSLALIGALLATTTHSADTAGPTSPLTSGKRYLSPSMGFEESKAHRESMKTYEHFWTITVALTTRNARNPQPLSKEWQQRILEAAGIPLEYPGVAGGDEHRFTPLKKITHAEAEEIAARIRTLPGILFAGPPPLEMGFNLAEPVVPPPPENRLSPSMNSDEIKAHRESMKTYEHFWTITVALTTRNARNPQPLSNDWQQRILEAAGIQLEYTQGASGDTHTFTPLEKITHSEAVDIAARIRALSGILFAEPPPVEMSINLAQPAVTPPPENGLSPSMISAEATPHPERFLSQPPDVLHLPSIDELGIALKNRDEENPKPLSGEWQARIIEAAGVPLVYVRVGGGENHVFKLPKKMTLEEAEAIAARIRALPEIYYADPSIGGGNLAVPNDPLFSSQWNLKGAGGGANLPLAWDITTGKNTVVVAVIDSGVLASHPELSGRVLPGYDFISDPTRKGNNHA